MTQMHFLSHKDEQYGDVGRETVEMVRIQTEQKEMTVLDKGCW